MRDISDNLGSFQSRLRNLIERHPDLSISKLGKKIGHKTGTAISALIGNAKSSRGDLHLSTFIKICNVLAEAYNGRMSESEITLYLLGFSQKETPSRVHKNGNGYPFSQSNGNGTYHKFN